VSRRQRIFQSRFSKRLRRARRLRKQRYQSSRSAATPLRHFVGLEPLENRVLLSGSTALDSLVAVVADRYVNNGTAVDASADPPQEDSSIVEIQWQDEIVQAKRGQWIAKFGDQASMNQSLGATSTSLASVGLKVRQLTSDGIVLISGLDVDAALVDEWAAAEADILYVEPDMVLQSHLLPDDPNFPNFWHLNDGDPETLADIGAPQAWDYTVGSRDVVVAIIDTGVDYDHDDLAANIWRNTGEIAGDGIDNDGNGFVDDIHGWDFADNDADPDDTVGHGTQIASIIGAVGNNTYDSSGVNWQVSMMPLRIGGDSFDGLISTAVESLDYITRMRRDHGVNIVVANASWGAEDLNSRALEQAIAASGEQDILWVAAAGNGDANAVGFNIDVRPEYPAAFELDNIISVTAVDRQNQLPEFANFGNIGVDLAAPGVNITALVPDGGGYWATGTSYAAAQVSGVAALLAAYDPAASAAEIKNAILAGVTPNEQLRGVTVAGGNLNALGAILALDSDAPHVVSVTPGLYAAPNASIQVQFDSDIDPTTLSNDSVFLAYSGPDFEFGTDDDAQANFEASDFVLTDGNLLTIDPPDELPPGAYYLILAGTGSAPIRGINGQAINAGRDTERAFVVTTGEGAYEPNDTIATATDTNLSGIGATTQTGFIGDGYYWHRDVDLFRVEVEDNSVIHADIGSVIYDQSLDSILRLFDANGNELAVNDDDSETRDSYLEFAVETGGVYYIGVSAFSNFSYDPTIENSGTSGFYTGAYELKIAVSDANSSFGDDLIVEGSYLAFGINADGSFITSGDDPIGARYRYGESSRYVEYLSYEDQNAGFSLAADGVVYENYAPSAAFSDIPMILSDLSDDDSQLVRMLGGIDGISIERTIQYDGYGNPVTVEVTLTNTGADAVADLAWMESLDVNGYKRQYHRDFPSTSNTNYYSNHYVESLVGNDDQSSSNDLAVAIASTDGRAITSVEDKLVTNPFDVINSPENPQAGPEDKAIAVAFDIGELGAGESTTLTYYIGFYNRREVFFDWFTEQFGQYESNDNINEALDVPIQNGGQQSFELKIGDGAHGNLDVDLFRVELIEGEQVETILTADGLDNPVSTLSRIFDEAGNPLADSSGQTGLDRNFSYTADADGIYYIGISGQDNDSYIATDEKSGQASATGDYQLTLKRSWDPESLGTVSGTVWIDENDNASRDADESGHDDTIVYVDSNYSHTYDAAFSEAHAYDGDRVLVPLDPLADPTSITIEVDGYENHTIAEVDVFLDVFSGYSDDLIVTLISPTGTRVRLADFQEVEVHHLADGLWFHGESDQYQDIWIDGKQYRGKSVDSLESLSAFEHEHAGGTWKLEVTTTDGQQDGYIFEWAIRITYYEHSTLTDAAGNYTLTGLPPQRQLIQVVSPWGSEQVSPSVTANGVELEEILTSPIIESDGDLGRSVALDGNLAVFSDPYYMVDGVNVGIVYVQDITTGEIIHELVSPVAYRSHFGTSVAISGDRIVVGAYDDRDVRDSAGAAYLYDALTGELIAKLLPDRGSPSSNHGLKVAIHGDTVVIGGRSFGNNQSFYVFDAATGERRGLITSTDTLDFRGGSSAIAINDDYIIVSDPDRAYYHVPSVFVFDKYTLERVHTVKVPEDRWANSFGYSLDVHGDLLLIGSLETFATENRWGYGTAFLYDLKEMEYLHEFIPPVGNSYHRAGAVVSLDDMTAAIWSEDEVLLFDLISYEQVATLNEQPATNGSGPGVFEIQNDLILVGYPGYQSNGQPDGAVLSYRRDHGGGYLLAVGISDDLAEIDFGVRQFEASIGDRVWLDENHDGVQDQGEPGISDVKVKLFDSEDNLLRTSITDADGNYYFGPLPAGEYEIEFVLPANHIFTHQYAGDDIEADSNVDQNTGRAMIVIGETDQPVHIDAGLVAGSGSISGYLWEDADADGQRDQNEAPIESAVVYLDLNANGRLDSGDLSDTTDADGRYEFNELFAGNYRVRVEPSEHYEVTSTVPGGDDGLIFVGIGDAVSDVNFGFTEISGSIGNTVWHDANGNGIQDAGELGMEGVTVELYRDTGWQLIDTAVTDANGNYSFTGLLAKKYNLRVIAPNGYIFTVTDIGSDELDNDFSRYIGSQSSRVVVDLEANEHVTSIDAGFIRAPVITGVDFGDEPWYHFGDGTATFTVEDIDKADGPFSLFVRWKSNGPVTEIPLTAGQTEWQISHNYSRYADGVTYAWVGTGTLAGGYFSEKVPLQISYPIADAGGDYYTYEGIPLLLDASDSFDAAGETLVYMWDLDNDGQYDDATGETVLLSVQQLEEMGFNNGEYTISLRIGDQEFQVSYDTIKVIVQGHLPEVAVDQDTTIATLGSIAKNTGTFFDSDGDVVTVTASIGSVTQSPDGTWEWQYDTTGLSVGSQEVVITATDDKGAQVTTRFSVYLNSLPVADAGGNYQFNELELMRLSAENSFDPDGDGLTYFWDFNGDGVWDYQWQVSNVNAWASDHPDWNLPSDGTPFNVTLRVVDEHGGFSEDTATVTLIEQPPLIRGSSSTIKHNVGVTWVDLKYADPDPLTGTVEIFDSRYLDWKLKEDLGLTAYIPSFDNRLPRIHKWFLGAGNQFYLLDSYGKVFKWTGDENNLEEVGEVTRDRYWADPNSLINMGPLVDPPQDIASFDPATKRLLYTPNGYIGDALIKLTVDDGLHQRTAYFKLSIENRTRSITIDDMELAHTDGIQTIQLPTEDSDGDQLKYTIIVNDGSYSAWQLDQQYNFSTYLSGYGEQLGTTYRFFVGQGGLFALTRLGTLYKWNGPTSSVFLGTVDKAFYDQPLNMIDIPEPAQPPQGLVTYDDGTGNLVIDPSRFAGSLQVTVISDDGVIPYEESFFLKITNNLPAFQQADVEVIHSAGEQRIQLPAVDGDGDPVDYTLQLTDMRQVAWESAQRLGLSQIVEDPSNSRFVTRPWFLSNSNQYYFLLSNGDLLRWGRGVTSNAFVANVGTFYYSNPDVLLNEQPPGPLPVDIVTMDHATDEIVINAQGFIGGIRVEATAWDGFVSYGQTFDIAIENPAPNLNLENRQYHHTDGLQRIALPDFAADGDPLSYSVSFETVAQRVWNVQQDFNITRRYEAMDSFFARGENWYLGTGGFYLLDRDGLLRKWQPGATQLADNPIIATLTPEYWQNPNLILNSQAPPVPPNGLVIWDSVNGEIIIDPAGYVGTAFITVQATDNVRSTEATFQVDITNTAPTIDLDDQELSHTASEQRIDLPATDADGDDLTYTVTYQDARQLAWDAVQTFGLNRYLPHNTNVLRANEKWLFGTGNQIYLLFDNGDLRRWAGSVALSPVVANVGADYYADPNELINVTEPNAAPNGLVTLDSQNKQLVINPAGFEGDLLVNVTVTDGTLQSEDTFKLSITNTVPGVDVADQNLSHTAGEQRIALPRTDADGDELTYTVTYQNPSLLAYQADQQFNFSRYFAAYDTLLGLNAKWILGNGGFYLLFNNGELRRWAGGTTADANPLVANVAVAYYDNPEALIDVALPDALPGGLITIDDATDELVINPTGFMGDALVTVTVSDGIAQSTDTFNLSVSNNAPTVDIADQDLSHTVGTHRIALPATDVDGDTLTYTVTVADPRQLAWEADQQFNFTNYFAAYDTLLGLNAKWLLGNGGFYLLSANGDLRRWAGSFAASPIVANVGEAYYDDPASLIDVQAPAALPNNLVTYDQNTNELVINAAGFTGSALVTVTADDGVQQSSSSFKLTVSNLAPTVDIDDIQIASDAAPQVIDLPAVDGDGDAVAYTVNVQSSAQVAFDVKTQLNLTTHLAPYHNVLGQNERWLLSGAGQIYLLLPNGAIRRWTGAFASSPEVARVDDFYWQDPNALINAVQPPALPVGVVSFDAATRQLTINPQGFVGLLRIELLADDGAQIATNVFNVSIV